MAEASRTISWQAPSHEHVERSVDWFWALGIIAIAGAVLAILFGNILLAAIILVGAFSLGIVSVREPGVHTIRIGGQGIAIDSKLYQWRSLKSFWVDTETRDHPHLIITSDGVLVPQLVIPLAPEIDTEEVRAHLRSYIDEVEQYESVLTRITELFGI